MGWTWTYKRHDISVMTFFKEHGFEDEKHNILDCAVVCLREAYMAYQVPKGIVAVICLLDYRPKDAYNFGYKDMDEGCGPGICRCPKRILEKLSPLEDLHKGKALEWARDWRERCWTYQNKPSVKTGDRVLFHHPIRFTNGLEESMFVKLARRGHFISETTGCRVRISSYREKEFTVVGRGRKEWIP